ncbi:MAG TPA: DNA mismatch repair endonuclease MutL [Bacteroidota bacterium]|nr:DNA mismatch repair endonuclease MutL [Bacteroidota bacterium]
MTAADSTIRVLPPDLADKIAAGEVVQRPSSAVKELVENSLDAGAHSVTVVLKDSGKTLLQVVDDGSGMGWEDALAAFGRHATSKISRSEDLARITTLGFRGEALAALSAVSAVELKTRLASEETGTIVRLDGGTLKLRERAGCPQGTSIIVRNLFYNTPGRRKFLKTAATEFRHILDTVQRAALSRPDVGFSLVSDGETILKCAPEPIESRIISIFGKKQTESLVPCREESEAGAVGGFLGMPRFARKGRSEQYIFLNGRPISSRNIGHAVYRAYEHLLEKGSFPFFVLFLTIDPRRTDVNVHPSKNEVKFDDESQVYRWVHAAVRKTLASNDLVAGAVVPPDAGGNLHPAPQFGQAFGEISSGNAPAWEFPGRAGHASSAPPFVAEGRIDDLFLAGRPDARKGSAPAESAPGPFWQIHDKYIIVPTGDGIMIVDQHAAHERVIYEKAIRRFESMEKQTQDLLFPQTLEMSPSDASLVRELTPLLENLGFLLKMFGPNTVILEGVPVDIRPGDETTILRDVIGLFKEDEQRLKLDPRERLAKSFSCKAAVKAGDRLNEAEMASLLEQLFRAEVPYVCPHGRPVMIRLSLSELDRRFGRTS